MQSLRSKIIIFIIRNRHLFKFKLRREIVNDDFNIIEFRKKSEAVSRKVKLPKDIKHIKVNISNIKAEWIIPTNASEDKVLLYIHGGGFISGSCNTHRAHVSKFASACNLKSLIFDYRLAPEHPFPAGLNDCLHTYQWLLDQGYKANNIVIGGESAGGSLVLSLLLLLKIKHIERPAAAFSISPLTDFRCLAKSFVYNAKKDIAILNSWNIWNKLYFASTDPVNPLVSPVFGKFSNMPPIYLCVGTHEVHYDDCVNLSKVLLRDKVDLTYNEWKNMVHAFPIMAPLFPEASLAMNDIADFVEKSLL